MQFEDGLLTYLPGKYFTVYKMIANNKKNIDCKFNTLADRKINCLTKEIIEEILFEHCDRH